MEANPKYAAEFGCVRTQGKRKQIAGEKERITDDIDVHVLPCVRDTETGTDDRTIPPEGMEIVLQVLIALSARMFRARR